MSSFPDKTFAGIGNLIKLLPTGTIFLYHFVTPILTGKKSSGECSIANKAMESALIALCGLSCFFASFTDSFFSGDGKRRYGFVTVAGLWIFTGDSPDLSEYRLRVGDFVHAVLALVVFMAMALLDSDTVRCFYPSLVVDQKLLLQVLPAAIGAFSGVVFVLFPNERHGIGYLLTTDDTTARHAYPTGKV